MNQIPSVDLRHFLSQDPRKKERFIREIGTAFEEIGFVALKGHFLTKDLTEALYREVKTFFALPEPLKKNYEIEGLAGQRGYTSFGKENAKGKKEADLKEFWHFGQEVKNNPVLEKQTPKNILVKELPRFNETGMKSYRMLEKTAAFVLRALAAHLGLDELYFDPFILNGNSILRPIHYPPIKDKPKGAERAAAHGDINLITLLMGAQGKGLQVKNRAGTWIDAIAAPEELIINVGDMLSRLTNNRLKSTIHRVTNPPKEHWKTPRYSIPFFMHPVMDMKLDCLPSCIDPSNPKQYKDITAGDFLEERLKELGLLK